MYGRYTGLFAVLPASRPAHSPIGLAASRPCLCVYTYPISYIHVNTFLRIFANYFINLFLTFAGHNRAINNGISNMLTLTCFALFIAAVSVYGAFFYRYTPRHERIADYLTYGSICAVLVMLLLSIPPAPLPV